MVKRTPAYTRTITIMILLIFPGFSSGASPSKADLEGDWIPYRVGKKWGYCNAQKKVLIRPQYLFSYPFSGPGADAVAPVLKGGFTPRWILINRAGKQVSKRNYDNIDPFRDGMTRVYAKDVGAGLIDAAGRELFPPRYARIEHCREERCLVTKGGQNIGKFGFVDTRGNEAVPLKYDYALSFSDGLAVVAIADPTDKYHGSVKSGARATFGYVDKAGNVAIDIAFERAYRFSDGLAPVVKNGKMGFIDTTGKVVIDFRYDANDLGVGFRDGMARVFIDRTPLYIDRSGNVIVKPGRYVFAEHFTDGMARVGKGSFKDNTLRYGYINARGEEVIPCQYLYAQEFSEGFASVAKEKDTFAYIDKTGKPLTPFKYFYLEKFENGFGTARMMFNRKDPRTGFDFQLRETFIDKTGREVTEFKYRFASGFRKLEKNWYGIVYTEADSSHQDGGYINDAGIEFFKE